MGKRISPGFRKIRKGTFKRDFTRGFFLFRYGDEHNARICSFGFLRNFQRRSGGFFRSFRRERSSGFIFLRRKHFQYVSHSFCCGRGYGFFRAETDTYVLPEKDSLYLYFSDFHVYVYSDFRGGDFHETGMEAHWPQHKNKSGGNQKERIKKRRKSAAFLLFFYLSFSHFWIRARSFSGILSKFIFAISSVDFLKPPITHRFVRYVVAET